MTNIYQKLANIQCALLKKDIKKSGYNKHKGFKYHELEDLIPPIFEECMKQEVTLVFTFVENAAILKIRDWNGKDEISVRITSPELVVPEKNPNNQLIQAVGANVTYLKRYLLVNTFLITESELIDSSVGNDASSAEKKQTAKKTPKKETPKKEPVEEVKSNLNYDKLYETAMTDLKKRGLDDGEINALAIKRAMQKAAGNKISRSEKLEIKKYVKSKTGVV